VRMSKPSYNQLIILFIPAALLAAYLDAGSLARFVDLKLPLWVMICWSIYVAIVLHVTTMAVLGSLWLKMPIKEMAIGFGKRWLKKDIAGIPMSFGIIPLGGFVKYGDNEPELQGWRRCVLELSGCAVLLALAALIMGQQANFDVLAIWRQFVEGALSPFGYAQVLLIDLGRYLAGLDDPSILAAMSFGMAAFNLLPLPILNGGNALMYFVSSTIYPLTQRAQERLFRVSLIIYLFGCGCWFLALVFLAYSSWVRTSG